MAADDAYPIVPFESVAAWEAWLEKHHAEAPGVWLKIAKKGSGVASVTHDEALDAAICQGWIDGQRKALDGTFFLQKFTRRRARSVWSKRNVEKVAKLIEAGRMRPAGLEQVELAKADGRWDAAYEGQRAATVPDDLRRELDRNRPAAEFFASLDSRNRYAILYRVQNAKRPETRARRIATFVQMLSRGEKIYG
jgi:uncharacterized protein YdeI (YjbR/CyaY-like superfamily)